MNILNFLASCRPQGKSTTTKFSNSLLFNSILYQLVKYEFTSLKTDTRTVSPLGWPG